MWSARPHYVECAYLYVVGLKSIMQGLAQWCPAKKRKHEAKLNIKEHDSTKRYKQVGSLNY